MANDAVTPPVVGSVSTETYGTFALSSRANAAEILASCIRLTTPSIILAPPDADTIISGVCESSARSTARVIISPTTAPILPPMNAYSITLATTARPSNLPRALITASLSPVSCCACRSRDEYGFKSTNFKGSVDDKFSSNVSYSFSSSNSDNRVRASMRKCFSHLGQTFKFSSRSFFQIICRQFSHLTHNPSVRTVFSPEVFSSPDSRLNQAIKVASTEYPENNPSLTMYWVLGTQYSMPLCAITPF